MEADFLGTGMSITIDQIAEAAGVSRTTVSRALNGTTKQAWPSSQRRVENIRRIAQELGYRRHAGAASTRSQRFGHVGMLTRDTIRHLQFNLTKGVGQALAERDLHLTYCEAEINDLADPNRGPKLLREHCVDGLIVHMAKRIKPETIEALEAAAVPIIWANTNFEFDCVYPDDSEAALRATCTLIQRGHRRIAFATDMFDEARGKTNVHYSGKARLAGYRKAINEAGLSPCELYRPEGSQDFTQVNWWREQLEAARPTAVVATSSVEIGYVALAAVSLGWQIPSDLSLIGFHDVRLGGDLGPKVSTMTVPMQTIGHEAVRMLMEKLKAPALRLPSRAVRYGELYPCTIAPPRQG